MLLNACTGCTWGAAACLAVHGGCVLKAGCPGVPRGRSQPEQLLSWQTTFRKHDAAYSDAARLTIVPTWAMLGLEEQGLHT